MVSLTDNGLCRRCNLIVVNRVQLAAERIYRSLALFARIERRDDRYAHAERVVRCALDLRKYEQMGLETTVPRPSRLLERFGGALEALAAKEERDARGQRGGAGSGESSSAESFDPSEWPGPASFRLVPAMDPMGSFDPGFDEDVEATSDEEG